MAATKLKAPEAAPLTIYAPTRRADADTRKMSARALLCTGNRDREGDVIAPGGVELAYHRNNPVALVDHGKWHPLPVGVCRGPDQRYTVEYDAGLDALWQTTHFSPSSQVAEQLFALIAEDVVRGNSINVRPVEVGQLDPDPERGYFRSAKTGSAGRLIARSELIEASWCAIPINPDAAFAAVEKSWCGRALDSGLVETLKPYLPARKAWSPGWGGGDPWAFLKSHTAGPMQAQPADDQGPETESELLEMLDVCTRTADALKRLLANMP